MNDFSELEEQLRKLRPKQMSEQFLGRVERALNDLAAQPNPADKIIRPERFKLNLLWSGVGLAAAALLVVFAHFDFRTSQKPIAPVASVSPAARGPVIAAAPTAEFIPAGATQVVYQTRDEGLLYPNGAEHPVRRFRTQSRETLQWRNPATGASLRVSYPSEQVELIPISGQ
jgi:hypothetical protein